MASELFKKAKTPKDRNSLLKLLVFIVEATMGPSGYANVPDLMAKAIEKLEPGLIQPRAGAEVDPAGNINVFATSKGVAALQGEGAVASNVATMQAPATESKFALETGFTPPPTKRGGIKANIYPFAQMQIGQSFFVPATEAKPNPAKALASTCHSASKRLKGSGRKFIARPRTAGVDGEKQTGARIFCVAAPAEAAATTAAA